MPAITYADWSGGLDRRLPITVQEASRLWALKNAYITLGKRIKKRPGLEVISTGLGGTFGLENINGQIAVFNSVGSPAVFPNPAVLYQLNVPPSATQPLKGVEYADLFNGFPFVVARYGTSQTFHHYIDGGTTYITDVNCPHTVGVTKAASRVFAPSGENVRYCAAGNARDWTTASDAGFLPAGLQQDTKASVTTCGTFQDALVVFFAEAAQIWDVNVDPSGNAIRKRLYGVGCAAPKSLASFFNDLMFLSPFGFRSMTVQSQTDRIDDTDVGVPIDVLVQAFTSQSDVIGTWLHQLGQYWAVFPTTTGCTAWVYSVSRASKLACWSEYSFPFTLTGITTVAGTVYVRNENNLYQVKDVATTDAGTGIDVEIQMAFQDAKTPGVLKQFYGSDFVVVGSPEISFKYDPRDQTKETVSVPVTSDTRPGDMVPIEVCATTIAPVFRHGSDEQFELDALTMYYNVLGTV